MSYYEEYDYNKPFSLKIWAKMLPFLKPYRRRLVQVGLLMAVAALVDVAFPLFLRYAIDHFIEPGVTDGLWLFAAVLVIAAALGGVCVILFVRLAMRIEFNIGRDLRAATFNHLQTLSFSYYNNTPVGYMLARVMSDTGRIGDMVAWGVVDLTWSVLYVLGVFAAMFALDWRLALLAGAAVPIIAVVTVWFQTRLLRINRQVRRLNSSLTGSMNEGISGARTTKTLAIEDSQLASFSDLTAQMKKKTTLAARYNSVFLPLLLFIGSITTAWVLSSGGGLVLKLLVPLGTLAAFINYVMGIYEPIQQIARILSEFVSTQANIERVTMLLEREPDITDTPEVIERYGDAFHPKPENWESIRGDIEFRDVTFRYPDGSENVLEHFNLTVPAGSFVAIVGETGAGKSTLVNLVCRFFEPTEGTVLIDGRDARARSQLWLHSHLGYVLQSPHLFSGSVRENIRYGRLEATDEEVAEAARIAHADQVIQKLPEGLDAAVGEGGDRLSTGEKQLISFARAVLADPRIFVLDEATSSIDTETEALIQQATRHLLHGRTSFVIAHRLSTIREADMILVVDDGHIIERGTHKELLRARGHYYSLYTRQFEEEESDKVLR
ncbi:MAG: ABC transporter ATP-binding protein/permease [Oscillospiraceae bacterium]|jgi:ATP-binding cassette subfamily B protein|nr:ABC transporter ATP-binding protein/permease [Oscillospiraceae bacterium]